MNRLFLGNPGTGKTTCASIYGRVLKCLNFLSIGDVVKKTAGDFIGQYVGQSQTKTVDILTMAKGKVLVIDEAYNLDDNLFGKQVLDVLVEKVQGNESDDIAVILIGYEQQMLEMLRTQNPGLARRFPKAYAFYFDDYSEQELLDIFLAACAKKNVHCPLKVSELVIRQLSLQKSQSNFGNAGAVELILKNAIANASARPLDGDTITLVAEDVENDVMKRARLESEKQSGGNSAPDGSQKKDDPLSVLDTLYRVSHIKDKLRQIQTSIQVAQDEGSDIPKIGHFVFRGSPGTGKTTVARTMAKIFHRMGILASDKLVETSGLNLTGEYLGHTKKRVEDQLGQARGGVLFIDEAYELGKGHFGEEAMTSLVAAMTNPMYAGMVIIVAGYPRDLDEMLDRNAGLKSRFTRFVDFYDWTTDDCVEFIGATSNREGYQMSLEAIESVRDTCDTLRGLPMFGNGRDVMQLWSEMLDCRAQRVQGNPELTKTLTLEDAEAAGRSVLANRKPATGAVMRQSSPASSAPVALDDSFANAPRHAVDTSAIEAEDDDEEEEEEKSEGVIEDRWSRIARDADVADDTWAELEHAKQENDAMLRALQEANEKKARDDAKNKLQKFIATQEKLRKLANCPMGFVWLQVGGGWRCAGGSHFVSDAELERSFMH
jgi:AAA+ superfamily predicted ATPase